GGQQACDSKTNGCIKWELFPIKLDSLGQRRYQIKVTNNCALKVNYVLFQLPNGVVAVAPADNSTYTDPTSNRTYTVRNPNFSPFYSVRFKANPATNLSGGVSDVFEYKLSQQSQPAYIHTLVKFEDGSTVEAHLNTYHCPILPFPNFGPNPTGNRQRSGNDLGLYPNPTDGQLMFDLEQWADQSVQIEVINAQGRLMQTKKVTAEAGLQAFELDGHLPNGFYHLVVRPSEGVPVAEPFILERN
ncbi:MAG: T9SS type A sorting domain-containing protein, partial [Saprospiraceae bacterium]